MYIEELLEVAIGLVFVWFMLALACMQAQEVIAGAFKLRARDLEKAIRGMLEEPESAHVFKRLAEWVKRILKKSEGAKRSELVDKLYNHQLIRALAKPGKKPSYIPDRTFALALFDVVMTAGTDASVIGEALNTWSKKLEDLKNKGEIPDEALQAVQVALPRLIDLVNSAPARPELLTQLRAVVEPLTTQYPFLKPSLDELLQATTLQQLTQGVASWAATNERAGQALNALIAGAGAYAKQGETALAMARTNIEMWFNDTMDRLTGWYKRRAQVITITLGVVFAIVFNADTVVIATTLWREPMIREALVAQAEKLQPPFETEATAPEDETEATIPEDQTEAADSEEGWRNFYAQLESLGLPIGWVPAKLKEGQQCTWNPWASANEHDEDVEYVLGIPIGEECRVPVDAPEGGIPRDWSYGLSKILGLLISGCAACLGAPFWFDVLKKLTNVRSAGKNPAEEDLKKKKV